ncbi:Wzz/FepE/Etk N-terminal domain-containing protein [Colwellia psychrerythraea]|uniref:Lipopolysaccharide biosynthesis protein n=1 Tax=Colwellia psychrerythraea TaxID=28229 RepID=A0A099KIV0_COLPS|nr:Wzz/FepE/Etk N-terminal domain-containing protein [Colwellia psychrerythraea]KGJ89917.1 lipopolysaccharide biosynthesis protein [Colwellia psychrerythraea]
MSKSVERSVENSQAMPNDANALLLQQQVLQQQLLLQNTQNQNDEIDLVELWQAIWIGKFTIIIISMIFAIASVFFALSKPNIYKASAILAPASNESGGMGGMAGQLGGLASMAGINLGGGGGVDKTALALEIIKSRSFIENFIEKHDLLVPLMASKSWDMGSDTLILNKEVYDSSNKKWLREVKAPKTPEPSSWECYQKFSKLVSVSQDKKSSMVNIEIEFYSPTLAKQWLTWLIQDINEFMRAQDQIEAKASIDFLTSQLVNIKVATMETVFYQLIEEQTKNMMLTMVKKEYVLKTIDPAQVPDTKAGPKRALIVVLGTMAGGIVSIFIVLIRYFSHKAK